jgi:hypothetical protein
MTDAAGNLERSAIGMQRQCWALGVTGQVVGNIF